MSRRASFIFLHLSHSLWFAASFTEKLYSFPSRMYHVKGMMMPTSNNMSNRKLFISFSPKYIILNMLHSQYAHGFCVYLSLMSKTLGSTEPLDLTRS